MSHGPELKGKGRMVGFEADFGIFANLLCFLLFIIKKHGFCSGYLGDDFLKMFILSLGAFLNLFSLGLGVFFWVFEPS